MNIGIIGAGAISSFLLDATKEDSSNLTIKSIFVRDKEKYLHLEQEYDVRLYTDLNHFIDSGIDIVVEAATVEAAQDLAPIILKQKDMVMISIGALADASFMQKIERIAEEHQNFILLPSGAIGGLDLIQSAGALGEITKVTLTTRKPATSLISEEVNGEKVIFNGKAKEAIKQFPKNINVSIILSLAGIGMDKTDVVIIAEEKLQKNTHEISVEGSFGKANLSVTNDPMKTNPKTSYLAALSVLHTLKNHRKSIKIGG